ncbi:MAG: hypothetical protein ISP01_04980 [Methanobrevibacter arboriphilus]|jgi:hypothetical protein|uniref:Uncharacterized protein n=2 Tax=Methanobrevibacter arboriphilus TaxID=39441 RepID=A0A843APM7_METAZ|nr:hypothetical protein [Methanobrevibacter arboriphilus]MBF4468740.1 hypothetical protein [Methanobrevibacter arboriphilus]MCC7561969.1 hypothetical protein [Methanobrevibacter arboriphilus]BBL61473.1 hypothetical protein MarbSA_05130 [Methanobrevibacter arboriphilus]GLI12438.1 hypothetical protein MARBORIA2_15280 [Methanobrevibacter arboriphilus]
MKQKTLRLMEDAISSAGRWTWLETSENSIQLDFEDVQLYKPSLEKYTKHSSEITIRLADDPFFTIYYNDYQDINFLNIKNNLNIKNSKKKNYFLKEEDLQIKDDFSYKIIENGLKFQDFNLFEKINKDYKFKKTFLGNIDHFSNINNDFFNIDVDFLLVVIFDDIAIVCGANQINFFNDFESLNDHDIKKLSNQWWVYWVDYWKSKKTDHEYEYDPACEVFLWI